MVAYQGALPVGELSKMGSIYRVAGWMYGFETGGLGDSDLYKGTDVDCAPPKMPLRSDHLLELLDYDSSLSCKNVGQ